MNQQFLQVWCVLLLVAFSTTLTSGENNVAQPPPTGVVSTSSSQHQDNVAQYVAGVGPYNPPSGYQYTEPNYGPQSYDNYLVPYPAQAQDDDDTSLSTFQYFTSVMPYTRLLSRAIAKIGMVILGGVALVLVGGLITTGVCAYTPLCTLQYNGWGINRETMRSLMTPDNLNTASAFVQDALEKYQKMQKRHI